MRFQVGGPLLAGSPSYVERRADWQAAMHLRAMDYVTLIGPPQQGKTSLISQLIERFSYFGYCFAYRDLKPLSTQETLADWYYRLGRWLLRQVDFLEPAEEPAPPHDGATWETFLSQLAHLAQERERKLVITLDQVGQVPPAWATKFFSVIRSVYTGRQGVPAWNYVTFILSGTFNPNQLIRDSNVSNFNVAQRIRLDDFSNEAENDTEPSEMERLVSSLGLTDDATREVATRIHHWTGGVPYLSQWLCHHLADQGDIAAVDAPMIVDEGVERLFQEDNLHLPPIIAALTYQPELLEALHRLVGRVGSPALAGMHFELVDLLGVLKLGPDRRAQIRNRIYERAIMGLSVPLAGKRKRRASPAVPPPTEDVKVFISYTRADHRWLEKLRVHLAPLLRGTQLTIWDDTRIPPGALWEDELQKALQGARVAVCLVTPEFLASEFIRERELPYLENAAEERGLRLLWIACRPSLVQHYSTLASRQALNDSARPLSTLRKPEQEIVLVSICEKIADAVRSAGTDDA